MSARLEPGIHRTPPLSSPAGPAVVLLHGFTSSAGRDWPADRWATRLAARGRETIAVDLPGHGAASPIDRAARVCSAAVLDAIDDAVAARETPGPIDLVGYSLGARLAWEYSGSGRTRVRRLVLGGLSPVEPFQTVDVAQLHAFLDSDVPPVDPLTALMVQLASAPGVDTRSLLALVEGLGADPFDPARYAPQCPTLLAIGADDPMAAGSRDLAALVPDAVVREVPGDHLAALEGDEFSALTFDFLEA